MTREELRDLRPGDYIWYSGVPRREPMFLFIVVGKIDDIATLVYEIIGTNTSKCRKLFEMPRGWSWPSYHILKREAFLNGENPWQTMVV